MEDVPSVLNIVGVFGPILYMEAKEYIKRYKYHKLINAEIENRVNGYTIRAVNALSKISDEICYYVKSEYHIPCDSVIETIILQIRTFENNVGLIFEELTDVYRLNREKIIDYRVFKDEKVVVLDKLLQVKDKNGGYIYPKDIINTILDIPSSKDVIIDGFKNMKKAAKKNPEIRLFPEGCLDVNNMPEEKSVCISKANIAILESSSFNDKELVNRISKLWMQIKDEVM